MSKNIEIPDYKILVPNSVWIKKLGTIVWPNGFQAPGTKMLKICKYRAPEEQEVMDLIQRIAIEYDSKKELSDASAEESAIYARIQQLPASEIENIAVGNAESFAHLRRHYTSNDFKAGKSYVQIMNATVPSEALRLVEDRTEKLETIVCESLMQQFGIRQQSIRIMLKAINSLPSNAEINYFLENGITERDVFSARQQKPDYTKVIKAVRLLYAALGNGKIRQVYNKSSWLKAVFAAETMRKTAICISTKEFFDRLKSTTNLGPIAILFSEMQTEEPKDKQDKDAGPEYLQRFSLN